MTVMPTLCRTDLVMLREGLRFCRSLGNTAPLSAAMAEEISPGSSVQSDEQWETWLAQNSYTEYHPSCSCAMLPQTQGGVVDANLRVYGLSECSRRRAPVHLGT